MFPIGLTVIAVGYTITKYWQDGEVGFNEIFIIALLALTFLSSITWGSNLDDGVTPEEDLGKKLLRKA